MFGVRHVSVATSGPRVAVRTGHQSGQPHSQLVVLFIAQVDGVLPAAGIPHGADCIGVHYSEVFEFFPKDTVYDLMVLFITVRMAASLDLSVSIRWFSSAQQGVCVYLGRQLISSTFAPGRHVIIGWSTS